MLSSIIGVVILLGGLIFFHELGHYSVAKFFGIRVEVFSLGFGKKLLKKKIGDTEYCLSLIPLGGYVKLMGDDPYKAVPPEDAHRAFSTQKLYKRFAVVAAGPISNLLLAYVLYTFVFFLGQDMEGTRIGTVVYSSPAWDAGMRPKDRISEINGTKVQTWNDMEDYLKTRNGQKVDLKVERGTEQLRVPFTVGQITTKNAFGEDEIVGGIKGIKPNPVSPLIGVSSPESPAYKGGIRTGDVITKINTREIAVYDDINEALATFWKDGEPLTFSVKRPVEKKKDSFTDHSFTVVLPKKPAQDKLTPFGLIEATGMYPSELFVNLITPGSPAEKGGLQPGDRISKVADSNIYNFESIVEKVQEIGPTGASIAFVVDRGGQLTTLNFKPEETTEEDALTHRMIKRFMIGFGPAISLEPSEVVKVRITEPGPLIAKAFNETNTWAGRMLLSIWKLVRGQISVKNLGGPVLIAKVAGKSLDLGITYFLSTMALISINLFLLNLFPVPVLDGGHLLFFTIEAIRRKPVSIRTMEIANQVGMVLILLLVALTFFNDISRATH